MAATHFLESRGQASSAGLNTARHGSHSQTGEQRTGIISRPETQHGMAATHILESRGQASSAGLKHSKAWQPLTPWRAKDKHHQQACLTARHGSHSQTGEQRTGIISRLETQQGMAATHILESRGQASSACLKHSKAWQPLTPWSAEDRNH